MSKNTNARARNGRTRARWVWKAATAARLFEPLARRNPDPRLRARLRPTRAPRRGELHALSPRRREGATRERCPNPERRKVSHATRGGEARHDHPQVVSARCRVATRRAWARSETPLDDGRAPRLRAVLRHTYGTECRSRPRGARERSVMILPQVHLRKPCYDFYFL